MTDQGRVLVFLRGALGDCLMTLPFLAALPGHLQISELTLVGTTRYLELLENQDFITRILDQDRAGWAGLYQTRPEAPERLVEFILSHQAAVIQAKTPQDPLAAGLKKLGLSPIITAPARPPADERIHLVDYMFRKTGVTPLPRTPLLIPSAGGLEAAQKLLFEINLEPFGYVVLHPGSGGRRKNWPLAHWLTLAQALERETGRPPLFLVGPAEEYLLEPITRAGPAVHQPLPVAAGLLALSRACVGHDSGISHLAAGLGVPTLALFGPTDPAQWAPRGPRVKILAPPAVAPQASWDWLSVEQVLQALAEFF